MKIPVTPRRRILAASIAGSLAVFLVPFAGQAGPLEWDPTADTLPTVGGPGFWNNLSPNWTADSGLNNVVWDSTDAIFGVTGASVTIDSGNVNASGLTFNVTGYTIDALLATDTLTLTAAAAVITNSGATINAIIDGTAGLNKSGSGVLTLAGVNIFTGTTTVTGGSVSVAADSGLGAASAGLTLDGGTLRTTGTFNLVNTRTVTVGAAGGTIDTAAATTLTVDGAIGGAGSLTKIGAGEVILSVAGTYSGATNVNAGTLTLGASDLLSATALNLGGGLFQMGAFNDTVDVVTLTSGSITSSTGVLTGTSYNVQGGSASAILAGGALTKTTGGTTVLTGVNTFTGAVQIDGGILTVNGDAALGNAANAVTLNGGALKTSADYAMTRAITLNNVAGNGLGADLGTTLTVNTALSGAGGFAKIGGGNLLLNVAGTYLGDTDINAGTLTLGASDLLPANAVNLNGGTFDLGAFNDTVGAVTLTSGSIIGAGILTAASYDVRGGSASAILAGGALTKTTGGITVLTGVNTYSGTVQINGGSLSVNADAALGNGANDILLDGGALHVSIGFSLTRSVTLNANAGNGFSVDAGQTLALDTAMSGLGGFTKSGLGTVQMNVAGSFSGPVAVTNGTLLLNTAGTAIPAAGLSITSAATPNVDSIVRLLAANQISDTAPLTFSHNGARSATLDLNGFTETVGAITMSTTSTGSNPGGVNGVRTGAGGTLILTDNIVFNHNRNATGNTGREMLITGTGTYGAPAASLDGVSGGTLNLGGVNRTITVNTSHVQANPMATIETVVTNGGVIKEGTGYLSLNGTNTFTGGITINAGRLRIAPNLTVLNGFTGGITANAGGTLWLFSAGTGSPEFNNAYGPTSNTITLNGGTILASYSTANDRTMTDHAILVGAGGGTIEVAATSYNNFVESGQHQLRLATTTGSTFTGSTTLTKNGGGRLTLNSNSAAFSGAWVVNNGTLEASGGTGKLGDGSGTNTITINGGNLAINGVYGQAFTLNGGAISSITNAGTAPALLNGTVNVTADSHLFLNDYHQDAGVAKQISIAGVLSGSAALNVEVNRVGTDVNSGVVVLQNTGNTYNGIITVGKNLRLQSNASGGVGSTLSTANIVLAGGHLQLRDNGAGSNGTLAYGNNVSVITPTGLLNNGDLAGTATLNADRSSGANTGNTIQLGALAIGAHTLDVTGGNGYGVSFGGLTTLSDAPTFNVTTAPLALLGGVDGDFSLVKNGTGLLTIGGGWTNAPTAIATVNAGTLQFNSTASLPGTGANITVAAGATLAAGFAIDQAFFGRIATPANAIIAALAADSANNLDFGAAGLTAARLGAVGSATFSGTLTPSGGVYRLGGGNAGHVLTLSGTNALTGANTLDVGSSGGPTGVVALTGSNDFVGNITLTGGELLRPSTSASLGNAANTVIGDGGGIQFVAGAPFDLFAVRTVTFGTGGFILDTNGNDFTPSAGINGNGGAGSFTKAGAGVLTFSAINIYTGVTNVTGGVLAFANPNVLAVSSGLSANGGTYRYTGSTAVTLGKTLILGATVGAGTIDVSNAAGNLTIDTLISGGPAATNLALTKTGPGTLTLITATNTFTGDIAVDGGTLAISGSGNADQVRLGSGAKSITLNNGSTFRVTSSEYNPTANSKRLVIGTGGAVFRSAGATAITLDDVNQLQGAGNLLIADGLTQLGNNFNQGTLPFTGNITIAAGARLRTFNANANPLGDTVGTTTVLSGGSLDIQSTGTNNETVLIEGAGNATLRAALGTTATNAATLGGPVTMTGAATVGGTSTGSLTLSNAITGAFALTKNGTATFALGGAGGTALQATSLNVTGGAFLLNNDGGAEITTSSNLNRLADASLSLSIVPRSERSK